jgi:DNA-3-methyladenine glycosylase II
MLLSTDDAALRGCGFSAAKVAAIRDIAAKAAAGVVPSRRAAARLSDAELIERLTTIRGVGRWTVEMLLIFSLGRKDVLPVDDFGVREGYRLLYGLEAQPKPRELAAAGEAWAPCRSLVSLARRRRGQDGQAAGLNASTTATKPSGSSACSQWPASFSVTNRAAGNRARIAGR